MSSKNAGLTVLIGEDELRAKISELAEQIGHDYRGRNPVLVGILKGSFIFLADLIRGLQCDHTVEFMMVSSYDEAPRESGELELLLELSCDIQGKDVVIVEDIVDSGKTLDYIYRSLLRRRPGSLEIVTLLDKKTKREVDIHIRYVGFEIPDRFVVGYGLDEAEQFRGLPYIAYRDEKG